MYRTGRDLAKKLSGLTKDEQWREAKRRCRLSDEAVAMAKELGMSPRGLIGNIPAPSERWKAPVEEWIRDAHEKMKRKSAAKRKAREKAKAKAAIQPEPTTPQVAAPSTAEDESKAAARKDPEC